MLQSLDRVFDRFVTRLNGARDERSLTRVATLIAKELGFDKFAYIGFTTPRIVGLSDYPTEWLLHYLNKGYQNIDPAVIRARQSISPVLWSPNKGNRLSKQQQLILNEAGEFGISSGITIPIHAGQNRFAGLTFASAEQGQDFTKFMEQNQSLLQLIGLYFHAHVYAKLQLVEEEALIHLTPREAECLAWAARGKTGCEIAIILGISQHTVGFHTENARLKLKAATLTQAVAEAVQRGWIRV